jgi:hypothetical protein
MHWHNRKKVWAERPDREKLNRERSERYHKNPEPGRAKARAWRINNPERARLADSAKYQKNKPLRLAQSKAYRIQHPEVRMKERANSRQRYPWKWPLINARRRSEKKSFAFDLTEEWCIKRWTGKCEISGIPFELGTQTHFPFSASIDRIKSSEGYTQTNCRFVLFAVNSFKGTGTDEQMLEIAKALIKQSERTSEKSESVKPAD